MYKYKKLIHEYILYIDKHMYKVCIYVSIFLPMYGCMYVCMFVCMDVSMYVRMNVYMYVCRNMHIIHYNSKLLIENITDMN